MTSQEIQAYVWNWLVTKGLPEKSTAGIMGNISQESAWDVSAIESGTGIGLGLCQWSFSRRTQLEAYGTDLEHQLNFLWSEMTGQNLSVTHADLQWYNTQGFTFTSFNSGGYSPSDSAAAFCWCWERPNASEANLSYRQSQAESFYTTYTGTTPPPNPPSDGNFYAKLLTTTYNVKQLSNSQVTFLKTLSLNDNIKIKYTFNHNKRQIGYNFVGNKLTLDDKTYILKDVRDDGLVIIAYGGNACYKYINPKYLKAVS